MVYKMRLFRIFGKEQPNPRLQEDFSMKIALINENSQAAKNGIIEAALKKVVEPPWATRWSTTACMLPTMPLS